MRVHLYSGSTFPRAHAHAILHFFDHRPPFLPIIRLFNNLQRWSLNTIFLTLIPIALVFSIHSLTLITKLGKPACILKWSNSTTLKLGLCIISQAPRNSMVYLVRIQFLIMSAARLSLCLPLTALGKAKTCVTDNNITVFKKQTGHFPFHRIIFDKDSAKENNDKARFLCQHLRLSHLIFIYLHAI